MTAGFRILPHPSDVGFEVWAPDFPGLLDQAVRALAAVETGGVVPEADSAGPRPDGLRLSSRAMEAVTADEDGLVLALERCLLEMDVDGWLAVGVRGDELVGTELDAASKENGTHVKAITWHQLTLVREADGLRATVYVDL